jgi:hypothetical protein
LKFLPVRKYIVSKTSRKFSNIFSLNPVFSNAFIKSKSSGMSLSIDITLILVGVTPTSGLTHFKSKLESIALLKSAAVGGISSIGVEGSTLTLPKDIVSFW